MIEWRSSSRVLEWKFFENFDRPLENWIGKLIRINRATNGSSDVRYIEEN